MALELQGILTPRQLAARLGVGKQTLENWRVEGKGPRYFKLGLGSKAHVRYRMEDIASWEAGLPHVDPVTQRRALEEAERVA